MNCLVTGAGGFIGGHLVKHLWQQGHRVRCADIKPREQWWQITDDTTIVDNCDLRLRRNCFEVCTNIDTVYNLAADMGGIGFIELNKLDCMLSVLINMHMLLAATHCRVKKYFYSSSACVYHADRQCRGDISLKEEDAYYNNGANPEDGYGWEKLFSERTCNHFLEERGLQVYVARFHNIYGPYGSWTGGREKAPAAICRKVAECKLNDSHSIDVWGNGENTRSFCYIDDCLHGIELLVNSDFHEPINIGSSELVTVNELIDTVETVAGYNVSRIYDVTKPQGVAGRNSDNTLIKKVLDWEPRIPLVDGIGQTYPWIEKQVIENGSRLPYLSARN